MSYSLLPKCPRSTAYGRKNLFGLLVSEGSSPSIWMTYGSVTGAGSLWKRCSHSSRSGEWRGGKELGEKRVGKEKEVEKEGNELAGGRKEERERE